VNSTAQGIRSVGRQVDSGKAPSLTARIDESYDRLYDDAGSTTPAQSKQQGTSETLSNSNEPSNTEITDQELMQAVCVGSRSAYQRLVKRHLKSISHYAYRLLGNQKDTQDITQEVFLRLWINAQKWNTEKSKLTTWLHRIAHNLCIDYLRKHTRMQTQDSFDDEAADLPSTNDESTEETNDKTKLLREALSALPENQRSALSLCHYQGFSNKEAAAIMNISVKALESAIARAKRSLREKLTINS
jgi:RNA polymerase sigma-70 factor (ECF subfamily)